MKYKFSHIIQPVACLVGFTAALNAASPVNAQHHHGDVFLEVFEDQIVTSLVDEDTTIHGVHVYRSELGEVFPNFSDEPGFDSLDGTFASWSEIGFDITSSLRVWNGADFDTVADSTMTVGFGPLSVETAGGFVAGFSIPVAPNGEWHKHLEFTLNSPATDGVYLLALQLWSTDSAVETSDPFYVVFNQNEDEAMHEEAAEFAEHEFGSDMHFGESTLGAGIQNTWVVSGAAPSKPVHFGYSFKSGLTNLPGCHGVQISLRNAKYLGSATANANGVASYSRFVPSQAAGMSIHFQAMQPSGCTISNWITHDFQ